MGVNESVRIAETQVHTCCGVRVSVPECGVEIRYHNTFACQTLPRTLRMVDEWLLDKLSATTSACIQVVIFRGFVQRRRQDFVGYLDFLALLFRKRL